MPVSVGAEARAAAALGTAGAGASRSSCRGLAAVRGSESFSPAERCPAAESVRGVRAGSGPGRDGFSPDAEPLIEPERHHRGDHRQPQEGR